MSVHVLRNKKLGTPAELALPGAPSVELANGKAVTPQHYLQFNQSLASLEALLLKIECEPNILLFAGELDSAFYLQVGIIGHENYRRSGQTVPPKLVYGRKWLITPDAPTSEVIQTAFLAIKKVREHEIREFIKFKHDDNKLSRPFSTHQDLPLLADNRELVLGDVPQANDYQFSDLERMVQALSFCERPLVIQAHHHIGSRILLDIAIDKSGVNPDVSATLPEMTNFCGTLILDDYNPSVFVYKLVDALIAESDKYVAERFTYEGYARFSTANDPLKIGEISRVTRSNANVTTTKSFDDMLGAFNYETDEMRTPHIGRGGLYERNAKAINSFDQLDGHMPKQ